jgi:ribonuclease HI
MTNEHVVRVYTDGSCRDNPSPLGGVGIFNQTTGIGLGYRVVDKDMTNNRAELLAVILSLMMEDADTIEIYTDSEYISKNLKENLPRWKENGYKKIKNRDLWEILYMLTYDSKERFTYIEHVRRGSHGGNVAADALAQAASSTMQNYLWDYKKDLRAWVNKNPKQRSKLKPKKTEIKAKPTASPKDKQTGTSGGFLPF